MTSFTTPVKMRSPRTDWLAVFCALLLFGVTNAQAVTNLTSLVNLFIGTASGANGGSGGNVFPGTFADARRNRSNLHQINFDIQVLPFPMPWPKYDPYLRPYVVKRSTHSRTPVTRSALMSVPHLVKRVIFPITPLSLASL